MPFLTAARQSEGADCSTPLYEHLLITYFLPRGIPICWPQFGGRGLLQPHGFARNCFWKASDVSLDHEAPSASVTFELNSDDVDLAKFRYDGPAFRLRYVVQITGWENSTLLCRWEVHNLSHDSDLTFTGALHVRLVMNISHRLS